MNSAHSYTEGAAYTEPENNIDEFLKQTEPTKENSYIDLSKCSEEQIKRLPQIIGLQDEYLIDFMNAGDFTDFYDLHFNKNNWNISKNIEDTDKTELLYPDFIKLFEGGEEENNGWIKIESELELPNDNEPMWVMIEDCELPELVQPDREADDFYGADGVIYHSHHITHYMPIVKPEPPKF